MGPVELTGVPQVGVLKKCTASLLVLLQGASLLVAPSAEFTLVGFLHWKEDTEHSGTPHTENPALRRHWSLGMRLLAQPDPRLQVCVTVKSAKLKQDYGLGGPLQPVY